VAKPRKVIMSDPQAQRALRGLIKAIRKAAPAIVGKPPKPRKGRN